MGVKARLFVGWSEFCGFTPIPHSVGPSMSAVQELSPDRVGLPLLVFESNGISGMSLRLRPLFFLQSRLSGGQCLVILAMPSSLGRLINLLQSSRVIKFELCINEVRTTGVNRAIFLIILDRGWPVFEFEGDLPHVEK